MRKIREILRLRFDCKRSQQEISKSLGVSSSTVCDCLRRVKVAKLEWPLPSDLSDEQLEISLYPPSQKITPEQRGAIERAYIHKELKRKHVTLRLLWNEYKEQYPQGIGYSQFCDIYREWHKTLDVWMRQPHKAGGKTIR